MFTYSVNVSIGGEHYFRIEGIASRGKAEWIARDLMDMYLGQDKAVRVKVSQHTVPSSTVVLDLN